MLLLDCPNGFHPIQNKCFKMMSNQKWETSQDDCTRSRGVLLSSIDAHDILIAKKLMEIYGVTKIFLGYHKDPNEIFWVHNWNPKINSYVNFEDRHSNLFTKRYIVLAELIDDNLQYSTMNGYSEQKANAICEYSKTKQYRFLITVIY